MRPADLTGAALIRENAMRLAADRGWDAVSIRDIAAAAGVSSSLVVHHYGTKDRLRAAVDRRCIEAFDELVGESTETAGVIEPTGMSIAAAFHQHLGPTSPVLAYTRRLLIDGGAAGDVLFEALFGATRRMLDQLEARGIAAPTDDGVARAAFLLVNDLAVILLRDRIGQVLGVDPFSRPGIQRWARTVMDVYLGGAFVAADTIDEGEARDGPPAD